MLEMKFEGLNKITNIMDVINDSTADVDRPHVFRTRCSISKHRKIFTKEGANLYGYCDLEIIKSNKNKCIQLTIKKEKIGTICLEVDDGVIKLR